MISWEVDVSRSVDATSTLESPAASDFDPFSCGMTSREVADVSPLNNAIVDLASSSAVSFSDRVRNKYSFAPFRNITLAVRCVFELMIASSLLFDSY